MASVHIDPKVAKNNPPRVEPEEIYYSSFKDQYPPRQLRIATGGAGQSRLIRALADAFIDIRVKETGCKPFAVAWLKSDTAGSFDKLAQASADLSITYHPAAEDISMEQGFAERSVYAWRDHFMLFGALFSMYRSHLIGLILTEPFFPPCLKIPISIPFHATHTDPSTNPAHLTPFSRTTIRTLLYGIAPVNATASQGIRSSEVLA